MLQQSVVGETGVQEGGGGLAHGPHGACVGKRPGPRADSVTKPPLWEGFLLKRAAFRG